MSRWLLLLFVPLLALAVACGDDDDGGGDALTEEEYFTRMDEIDKVLDPLFADESGETAGDVLDSFKASVDVAQEQYGVVSPPADLEDEHDALVAAVDSFAQALDTAAEEVDPAGEPDAFFEVFANEDLAAADEDVTNAFCAIQAAADEAGVEADVGCEVDGEGEVEDPAAIPPVEQSDVEILDFTFDPPHVQVSVGDTVTWTNSDSTPHTATEDDDSFDTDNLAEGESGEVTFDEAGVFTYKCTIHPAMVGAVTVVE